jgi:hypothetical protein
VTLSSGSELKLNQYSKLYGLPSTGGRPYTGFMKEGAKHETKNKNDAQSKE